MKAARDAGYRLDDQVGFILRQVSQRHAALFAAGIGADITPTQWAVLARLSEAGPLSQNLLGRRTSMDVATVKGVVDRLTRRGLIATEPVATDRRRLLVTLTDEGREIVRQITPHASEVTRRTLAPLREDERRTLLMLLRRLR